MVVKENKVKKFEFRNDQLNFPSFEVSYKYHSVNEQLLEDRTKNLTVSGFTLDWYLQEANGTRLTEKLPERPEDWKTGVPAPMYENPWFRKMVMLAKELRVQNLTRSQIKERIIQAKVQNITLLSDLSQCAHGNVNSTGYLNETFASLVTSVNDEEGTATKEDLEVGFELFGIVTFCPSSAIQL